ncbi:SpaA isopeptide-forming pilin-related protein, partial [Clostridium sp.]
STVTDLVRINENRTHLDYWFDVSDDDSNIVKDMNGVNGWGGSINEPGYFPFNKPEDGSKIEKLNYGFGTKLEIPFTLTQDGQVKTINNNEKRDIQFNFKGDDDVWVYIDGNLVLDMGGAHSQTVGNINFKNRTATVDRVIKGSFRSHNLYQETGESIKNFTLSNDSYINGDTSQGYNPSKVHTLTMFYMERGLIESNLYVDFNFIPVENELIVEKEVDITNVNEVLKEQTESIAKTIDFNFKAQQNTIYKTGIEYELNRNEELLKMNGEIFTLKDEYSAKFYSKFNKDSKVIIEEVSDNRFRTSWQIKDITVNLENENDKERNITTGSGNSTDEFKISTTVNAYDKMSHYVKFINEINTGTLNICKNIELLEGEKFEDYTNDIFDFKVSFTSILGTQIEPINYNGSYSVFSDGIYKEDRQAVQVGDYWVIQLKAGETAEIKNIPVYTEYEIEEILGDKYEIQSINGGEVKGNTVKGKITVEGSEATVTYVNKKKLRDMQLIKVDSIDSNIKLEGAKFILNKLNENGSADKDFKQREVTTDTNGQAYFGDLPYGKYIITEIKAPEGYELLKEPIKFEINKDNNSIITIEVKNNKSIKLPIAGGNGNSISKYVGFMLIGLSIILYVVLIIRNKNLIKKINYS